MYQSLYVQSGVSEVVRPYQGTAKHGSGRSRDADHWILQIAAYKMARETG